MKFLRLRVESGVFSDRGDVLGVKTVGAASEKEVQMSSRGQKGLRSRMKKGGCLKPGEKGHPGGKCGYL